MGIINVFKTIGRGFKGIGKGVVSVVRRPELQLIARFLPVPYLMTAIAVVTQIDSKASGSDRMVFAINALRTEPRFAKMKESELRWIIETALQVVEGRVAFQERRHAGKQ